MTPTPVEKRTVYDRIRAERANCEWAVRELLAAGEEWVAVQAAAGLGEFGYMTGTDTRKVLEEAGESVKDKGLQALCIQKRGRVAEFQYDYDGAVKCYTAARPLFAAAGGKLGEASCVQGLADLALRRGEWADAAAGYAAARPLFAAAGDKLGEANCVRGLADLALRRGEWADAAAGYAAARPLFAAAGGKLGEANCDLGTGDCARMSLNPTAARQHFQAALSAYQSIGDQLSAGAAHWSLARVAVTAAERAEHLAAARVAWANQPNAWTIFPELFHDREPHEDDLPPLA